MKRFILFIVLMSLMQVQAQKPVTVHAVTDLAHEFTFYADHRFHRQYLPGQHGETNWCDLYHFDFSNANLLILPGCDDRIQYVSEDVATIQQFLKSGGGVVILGSEKSRSQNQLLTYFGAEFTVPATLPLSATKKIHQIEIEGNGGSVLEFDRPNKWEVLIKDGEKRAVMARRKVGNGTLLVSARALSGSHPSARDSINKEIWKPLLIETAAGKKIDPEKEFKTLGIDDLEYNDDHGTFRLSYNHYMKPFANAMVEVYKRSMPFIEKRMGVPLSPGMASQVTLLATGGGGFSSGTVVALAIWWGGFPDREDGMIEFLTHESVHSWVLPFAEVWNEPIASYVGDLVMMDMGYEEEAIKRIKRTIDRAVQYDSTMTLYDLAGNLTGTGRELKPGEKNNIHWGKSFWIFEQLREHNPDFIADYFRLKREHATPDKINHYDINMSVSLLSMVMSKDLFPWLNHHGIPCYPPEVPEHIKKDYQLVWNEEFDGSQLNLEVWNHRGLESVRKLGIVKAENSFLDGQGHCVIQLTKEGGQYHIGQISTMLSYLTRYGYFECRARMNHELGPHIAFWLQSPDMSKGGDPATAGAEIDIFEYILPTPDKIYHTIHYGGYAPEKHQQVGGVAEMPGIQEGFHTFGLEWLEDEYIFYVDGKVTWRTKEAISNVSQYMILSLECTGWGGDPDKAKLPDEVVFDYVRVYQKK